MKNAQSDRSSSTMPLTLPSTFDASSEAVYEPGVGRTGSLTSMFDLVLTALIDRQGAY